VTSRPARASAASLVATLQLILASVSVSVPAALAQAPLVVRTATLVPDGSSWYLILKELSEKWKAVSAGRVTVRLFPGGVAGDDLDVVRKMRLGTLGAGVLTSVGVAEIDKSVYALGVPLMYDSSEEVYYVLEKMRPRLEANIEAKGFVVLNWADVGWVHFFTQKPVAVPDDLRALKLFTWAGDADSVSVWRSCSGRRSSRSRPGTRSRPTCGRLSWKQAARPDDDCSARSRTPSRKTWRP
jgi:TRAP-type C4-dicarboxylate transport system substrate-binding protein